MARSLVIVESPAKARTINRYLGKEYLVKSSVGHVRDLPAGGRGKQSRGRGKEAAGGRKAARKSAADPQTRARRQLVQRMGVDPDRGWRATYEVVPGKEKVVGELKKLADASERIFLATDLDREGEAIAWHLKEVIGGDPTRFRRVVFNEITSRAIRDAFENPGEIDRNRVNAQQARRFLDRVVGFEVSPLLWAKVARGLSAGRVQSVAVRLVVEREREIRVFEPEEYWEVFADLTRAAGGEPCRFQVVRSAGRTFRPRDRSEADEALARLRQEAFTVARVENKPATTRPPAPFITSTLQQAASTRLGFGVRKTMTLAQRLYEGGHVTYMRTDSTNLSREAVSAVRAHVESAFGPRYLPRTPNVYASKAGAQEAHEAIRPTDVGAQPGAPAIADADARRLYDLIRRQFIACQMTPAEYLGTTVTVEAGRFELRVRGRVLRFDGFTRVLPPASRKGDLVEVPGYERGERLACARLDAAQHFTKPPPRYSEASLVRELEKRGIGRPSTYASIISTIQDRGYVTLRKRRFYAEKIGEIVTDRLVESFADLLDYSFTAGMEQDLDQIASGDRQWLSVLDTFYDGFSRKLAAAARPDGMRPNTPTETAVACPACGRAMQVRSASTGVFLGCSGYSLPPGERCTKTVDLTPADEAADADRDDEGESRALRAKRRCPRLRRRDGRLRPRRRAQAPRLRQESALRRPRGGGGGVPGRGAGGADHRMRPVRRGDAAPLRTLRQVLRLHRRRVRKHPQAAPQRGARAAEGRPGADAGAPLPDRGRSLRAAGRGRRAVPGRQRLSPQPGDARARGVGAEGPRGRAGSQVPLSARGAGNRSRRPDRRRPLFAQGGRAVRHVGGERQGHPLARRLPGPALGRVRRGGGAAEAGREVRRDGGGARRHAPDRRESESRRA